MGIPMYPLFPDKPGCGGRVVVFFLHDSSQAQALYYRVDAGKP